MRNCVLVFLFISILFSCRTERSNDTTFESALQNGYHAQEGFDRSLNYVRAWLQHTDPVSGLLPRNLTESGKFWNAKDAAADNYPFMVLTSFLLEKDLFEGKMKEILRAEQQLTNRVDRLPDDYAFHSQSFRTLEINMDEIIFGSSEYIKDGLLPLTEYLGSSAWSERMIGLLDDIWKHAPYDTPFGKIPSFNVEVNGELLQALSRVYWMTGERKYLDWAIRLGDYYFMGDHHPTRDAQLIRLRDHGCEIISGLSELYVSLSFVDPNKRDLYRPHLYEMLDRILAIGRNEHGLFYNEVNPVTGEILDGRLADNWGYTLNAYYAVYLVDGYEPYREPILTLFGNLHHYESYDWENGSADGYADAIESALNLLNREPSIDAEKWIDTQIQVMWSMQDSAHRDNTEAFRNTGIIEGWHGDGNFARTSIMYSLWKTKGTTLDPWENQVLIGGELKENQLVISAVSDIPYSGVLKFDFPRHITHFNLPLDYPRINQFPEWFVVEEEAFYRVNFVNDGTSRTISGKDLRAGIAVQIQPKTPYHLIVELASK